MSSQSFPNRLAELLKSKKPEDLQEANRLIKNMVKEDEELYGDCDKLRQTVFKLATETEDNDSHLGTKPPGPKAEQSEVLIDLVGLDLQAPPAATPNNLQAPPSLSLPADLFHGTAPPATPKPEDPSTALLLLGQELLSLGPSIASNGILQDLALLDLGSHKPRTFWFPTHKESGRRQPSVDLTVLALSGPSPVKGQEISLSSVKVSLKAIKPSKVCPVTAYDKYGIRVLLHFASDCPPDRPDVLVMVASMLNSMKLRIQSPSGTELAAFNPILPPAAITQIILLANPLKEKVRMRYKLAFTLGEQPCTEVGEVEQFPPADKWGAL
ncbi:hypothetical protein NHX12_018500 [Muraenolepis orangiensis]|uniref:GAE domain-containing protein n=1 Tax=Muraenolepis orangiensis TaxID=630683 RepID=A0A9Q0EWN0_9TELE|nr:hypothetical protein NHX12_018500 [Muraenolepis orangiensis]